MRLVLLVPVEKSHSVILVIAGPFMTSTDFFCG